jgi:predicted outer membrane lipoprotein
MPALLVERAIALGRAEVGLALVHTRRIAVRAVSALLGTIVACAFAQLTLVLLIAWPVLVERIPLVNLLAGVLMSAALAAAGGIFAALTWSAVARERRPSASSGSKEPKANGHEMNEPRGTVNLTERVS